MERKDIKKIYYVGDRITAEVKEYLERDRLFKKLEFVPVSMRGLQKWDYNFEDHAVLIWGSGFKHHVSFYFRPRADYFKSMDDHHDDFKMETLLGGINGSSHLATTLFVDDWCKGAEILWDKSGGKTVTIKKMPTQGDKNPPEHVKLDIRKSYLTGYKNKLIHKSIDLDIINGFPAWPECQSVKKAGRTLDQIKKGLKDILDKNDVRRFDIGGLHIPNKREQREYKDIHANPVEGPAVLEFGLKCYKELIEIYLTHGL